MDWLKGLDLLGAAIKGLDLRRWWIALLLIVFGLSLVIATH